eukprot:gene31575-6769_t
MKGHAHNLDDVEASSSDDGRPPSEEPSDLDAEVDSDDESIDMDVSDAEVSDEDALHVSEDEAPVPGVSTNGTELDPSAITASSDAALFQLQIGELLNETRVNYPLETSIASFVSKLRKALASIPSGKNVSGERTSGFIHQLGLDPMETSIPLLPPTSTHVVGSFGLRCVARPVAIVDLAVQIPEECLFKKAYLNYRYHARRAVYLAALGSHLAKEGLFANQELQCTHDDPTRPLLLIHPPYNSSPNEASWPGLPSPAGFVVCLIPVLSPQAFIPAKLGPARNSVRSVCKPVSGEGGKATTAALPTPHYNQALLQDMMWKLHSMYLKRAVKALPAIVDGILLLKVWVRQRGLSGPDGPSGHMLALLLATLAERGKVSAAMTPQQMLRSALHVISDPSGAGLSKGLAMSQLSPERCSPEERACFPLVSSTPPPALATFKQHFDVVFVDPSGWVNLAANMSKSVMSQLRSSARQTLALMESPPDPEEAFHQAFMARSTPATTFDYCWRVRLPDASAAGQDAEEAPCSICKDRVIWRDQEAQVEAMIKQALSDRSKLVRVVRRQLAPGQSLSDLSIGLPKLEHMAEGGETDGGPVLVGANVEPTNALRLVDIGPAADDTRAAAKFRAFWGDRSELRRFQDGKISEAVFWDLPPAERHCIIDRIVEYAAERHLPPGSHVSAYAAAYDSTLDEAEANAGAGIAAFRRAEAALDKLGKQLRSLDSLALKVVGVQPISAVNRQTVPFFPRPHPLAGGAGMGELEDGASLPRCLEPISILVQLEGSGRWPENPEAFKKMKAAMGLQLAEALHRNHALHTSATEEAIDVLMDGFVFRLVLYSGRDEAMLSKVLLTTKRAPAELSAEESPLMHNWHHGLISLIGGANPAYAPSVRLARRWVGAHMLSNSVCGEAVELMVAAAFITPGPLGQPASRIAGFLRFLQLLATHPWAHRPLVVDPEKQLTQAVRRQLQRRFDERRSTGHGPALYVCTPKDLESSHWTSSSPSAEVMKHAVSLASKAYRLITTLIEKGLSPSTSSATPTTQKFSENSDEEEEEDAEDEAMTDAFLSVFVTPLEDYDCLLLLALEALPQAGRILPLLHPLLQRHVEDEVSLAQQGKKKRKRGAAYRPALLFQQPDALSEVLAEGPDPAPKRARAFLSAFPEQVVSSHGPNKLRQELLIGFDPIQNLLDTLESRFGHIAIFCADLHGGVPAIAVKWSAKAFISAQSRVPTYHTALPCMLTASEDPVTVPNICSILVEMRTLGEGLVSDAMFIGSCGKVSRA